MSADTISLLVPCYNASRFVESFLDSVRKLDPPFDEVIFYDDCSSDDTARKLDDAGAYCIRGNENLGSGAARNHLLSQATSRYVHFHDIDDPFHRADFVGRVGRFLDPELTVFGRTEFVELDGSRSLRPSDPSLLAGNPAAFFLNDVVHLNATIWPKTTLSNLGGFRSELRTQQDVMLFIDAHAAGVQFFFIDEALAVHLKHLASTIQSKRQWEHELQALRICSLAAGALPEDCSPLVASKAIYHLRRLAQYNELRRALEVSASLDSLLELSPWQGGAFERGLVRAFGPAAGLVYCRLRSRLGHRP